MTDLHSARLACVAARTTARAAERQARGTDDDDAWFAAWEARDAARRAASSVRMAKYYSRRGDDYHTGIAIDLAMAAAVTTASAYARMLGK